ncbi:MAG TPA: hypothetical protein VLA19_14730 [Herpetosiphonaceae bacterium]|nr:hypothetical protein [Herpetosiphonaceae bacterium]
MTTATYDAALELAQRLSPEEQLQLIEALEDAADVAAYDAAKARIDAGEDEVIPFEQALAEIEAERAQAAAHG